MRAPAPEPVTYPEELVNMLLETIPEALLLTNEDGRIAMINSNTETLFGYRREELLGKRVEVLIPARFHARHRQHHARYNANPKVRFMGERGVTLVARRKDASEFPVEISLGPVDLGGKRLIWCAIRDITERERLNSELRKALDEVNALRGLLSICASCKRIRDERGNWQQLESYIQSHSQATFTHGLCEECIRKLFPEYRPHKT